MAAQHGDGFELTVDQASADGLYGAGNFSLGAGAAFSVAGGALQGNFFQGGTGISIWKLTAAQNIFTADPFIVTGFRIRANSPTNNLQIQKFLDGTNLHCRLQIIAVGADDYRIAVFDSTATERGTTATLAADTWYFIEFKVTINDSGPWVLRVNEVTVASGTHDMRVNTGAVTCNVIEMNIQRIGASPDKCDIDDCYFIVGTTGSRVDFLGDGTLEAVRPSGVGSSTQWTPNTGTNWDAMNDVAPDDDSTYVSAAANSLKDMYAHTDLVFGTAGTPILFAVRRLRLRLLSAGSRNVQLVYRRSGIDTNSATINYTSTAYVEKKIVEEKDPATLADWSVADINAAEFGLVTVP